MRIHPWVCLAKPTQHVLLHWYYVLLNIPQVALKENSGVKLIWDMFSMMKSLNVRWRAKESLDAKLSDLFIADSTKLLYG